MFCPLTSGSVKDCQVQALLGNWNSSEDCIGFVAVPVPQAETLKTAYNAQDRLDIPSPQLEAANLHGLQERQSNYTNVGRDTVPYMVLICIKLAESAWTVTSDGACGCTEPWWWQLQRGAEMTILRKKPGDPLCFYCWHTWKRPKSIINNIRNNTIQEKLDVLKFGRSTRFFGKRTIK